VKKLVRTRNAGKYNIYVQKIKQKIVYVNSTAFKQTLGLWITLKRKSETHFTLNRKY